MRVIRNCISTRTEANANPLTGQARQFKFSIKVINDQTIKGQSYPTGDTLTEFIKLFGSQPQSLN